MARNTISLRMSVEGDAEVRARLQALGTAAEAAAGSVDQVSTRAAASFQRYAASIDPALRAQMQFEQAQQRINAAVASGAASQEQASRLLGLVQARYDTATRSAQQFATASAAATVPAAGGGLAAVASQLGGVAQQAVQGGSAFGALAEKARELLGQFGPLGAVAAGAIGLVVRQINSADAAAQAAAERMRTDAQANAQRIGELNRVIAQTNDLFLTQAERARNASNAATASIAANAQASRDAAAQMQAAMGNEIAQAETALAAARRLAEANEALRQRQNRAGVALDDDAQGRAIQARVFSEETRLAAARAAADRAQADLVRANEAVARLRNAGRVGTDEFGPPAPDARDTRERAGAVARLSEAQREYQQIMRDAEGQVTRLMSEEERRTATLNRLYDMQRRSAISDAEYIAALEAQGRAVAALQAEEARRADEVRTTQARQAAERLANEIDQQNRRTTDSIVRYGADAFADMFEANGRGWRGMLDGFLATARRTFARIAAEAVIRPIVAPIVAGLGIGGLDRNTSLAGSGGGVSQFGAMASGGGNGQIGMPNLGGLRGFTDGSFSSGWAGLDSTINTPLYSTLGEQFGPFSAANPTGAMANGGTVTIGGAAAGALGIAGGAYGIYSGLQTGGARGGLQVAGGVAGIGAGATALAGGAGAVGAAGTAALGASAGAVLGALAVAAPYLAAIAAIAAMFVPGQKPSNAAAGAMFSLGDGARTLLDSGKSVAATRDGRDQLVTVYEQQIAALLPLTGGVRPAGTVGFNVGARDGSDIQYHSPAVGQVFGERYETGDADRMTELVGRSLLYGYRDQVALAPDIKAIFANSAGLNDAIASLQWYSTTYRPMLDSIAADAAGNSQTNALKALADQVAALQKPFQEAAAKAASLGLATAQLAEAQAKAVADFEAARAKQQELTGLGLDARLLLATGREVEAALLEQRVRAEQERQSFAQQLMQLAPDRDGWRAEMLGKLDAVQAAERQQLLNQQAESARARAAQGAGFFENLIFGGAGGLAPQAQYLAGLQTLAGAGAQLSAGGADALSNYTRVAQSFLPVARNFLGTSSAYAGLVSDIAGTVRSAGGDPNNVAAIFEAQANGFDQLSGGLSALSGFSAQQVEIGQSTLSEIRRLAGALEALIARRIIS